MGNCISNVSEAAQKDQDMQESQLNNIQRLQIRQLTMSTIDISNFEQISTPTLTNNRQSKRNLWGQLQRNQVSE
ncbi:hypothetical protein SS50377_22902 [Spironucleus salmonicida]|uniref:Uncharacterized protein n=1 Tax=Spironucleus salmonicida TaxID=348837 RepID=V6LW10_9EUKA|nr:hypothetical protein SS50377_22902 [Spironucleus salmonicida]|eukprot:EST48750.1 Hypothetical protein SS50377_11072 [Spironucleus salmonicida]